MSQPDPPTRVLLVDDNLDNLQVLYQALEDEGLELLLAQSGEEAINTARETHPSVILLDINMPGLDGYETCRRLKQDPETQKSIVVFLSARGALADKLTGFDCGAVDYIEKPFQFEEVIARVRSQIAAYERERKLEDAATKTAAASTFGSLTADQLMSVIAKGEDDLVEFKSTLRRNLHTGKNDKRMENACLKSIAAFLNSHGGLLLIGVSDDGNILGLEADEFQNHDKYLLYLTSLIRTHLGSEFSQFVRAQIHTTTSGHALSIECLPSPQPVYFRRDQDEIFFVRSGPSTQQLRPSQIVAYVNHRTT